MAEATRVFSQLIQAAVDACGTNMQCIIAYVEEHQGKLNPREREQLESMIQHINGFQEPDKPFKDN